jgi:hypothetical protein
MVVEIVLVYHLMVPVVAEVALEVLVVMVYLVQVELEVLV